MIEYLFAESLKDILGYSPILSILDKLAAGKVVGGGVDDDS